MRTSIALAVAVAMLAGCNTVEGVGMDISGTARTVGGWLR
ncbi:lipoprotein [Rhodobaculum claviforme]|nr:lipoprotein [Rhodobaculum claviforme]